MYQLPYRSGYKSQTQRGVGVCVQQRELLRVPQEWRGRIVRMRSFLPLMLLAASCCAASESGETSDVSAKSTAAPVRSDFHVRYVNSANVYIDGGHNAGLAEGTKLVLKQDPTKEIGR